jgi:hypothetical protein
MGVQHINMYGAGEGKGEVVEHLADLLRAGFAQKHRAPALSVARTRAVG